MFGRGRRKEQTTGSHSFLAASDLLRKTMAQIGEFHQRTGFASPDNNGFPLKSRQRLVVLSVTSDVRVDLCFPIIAIGRRQPAALTTVTVPKASVYEDSSAVFGEDDVRRPRKIASMHAETIAQPVKQRPNEELLTRIAVLDSRHDLASLLLCKHVH